MHNTTRLSRRTVLQAGAALGGASLAGAFPGIASLLDLDLDDPDRLITGQFGRVHAPRRTPLRLTRPTSPHSPRPPQSARLG